MLHENRDLVGFQEGMMAENGPEFRNGLPVCRRSVCRTGKLKQEKEFPKTAFPKKNGRVLGFGKFPEIP